MKNRLLSFFVMMICFVASCFVSCGNFNGGSSDNSGNNGSGTNVTITETSISIWITSYPDKVYYQVNEPFDSTGLAIESTIIEKYSDGTEKTFTEEIVCPNENITFSGTDFSTVGTKNITIIYTKNEMTAYTSFEVTVGEGSLISNTLDSISIKTLPTKTEYKVNEEFDPTGLEITAIYTNYYSDNSTMSYSNDISYNNNMTFSGTDFSTVGTKTITVTYTENETSQFATFQITVKAAAFSSTINYTTFDTEINSDLSIYNGKAMTLYLDTTTVNIAKLYEQYTAISSQVGENGSVAISYADAGKTTIEGDGLGLEMDLEQFPKDVSKYNAFFNAIAPENATAESLPSISTRIGVAGNLYGTGIDKLFEKYYNLGAGDKLQGVNMSTEYAYFDALDHLNRDERGDLKGKAYDNQGEYIEDSYYNLNVNAALLMNGTALKNVNVTGTLEQAAQFASKLTNVRFNVDSNGKEFTTGVNGIGLIEFAGDAPSVLPNTNKAKVIISNTDNTNDDILLYGGAVIDFSKLSSLDDNTGPNFISGGGVYYEHAYFKNENAFNNFKSKGGAVTGAVYYTEDGTSSIPNYKTNQQWINAANANNGAGDFVQGDGNVFFPSPAISKLNFDEKNNTLLNTILFNNQKVYG